VLNEFFLKMVELTTLQLCH